jgi:hypothetical protein
VNKKKRKKKRKMCTDEQLQRSGQSHVSGEDDPEVGRLDATRGTLYITTQLAAPQ